MKRFMSLARWLPNWGLLFLQLTLIAPAAAADEAAIKIGILHSLSGTMAIIELVLKDTVLMLIAVQNDKGGLLGRKLEPVIADPASDWNLFAEKARDLLTKQNVAVVFGCWTSAYQIVRKKLQARIREFKRCELLGSAAKLRTVSQ